MTSSSLDMIEDLKHAFLQMLNHSYPHVENPITCPKRASVALIFRIRPSSHERFGQGQPCENVFRSSPNLSKATKSSLDSFFDQRWVRDGEVEVLFIRRATRVGDRWTGHVALPGGKRDPEDEDDEATAIRETFEEIGLDLFHAPCCFIGNLPQRLVTTAWGKVPLMILCPYVYLLTAYVSPVLKLQPTEVDSVHWVPLQSLLSRSSCTFEYCDVSDRLTRQGGPFARAFLRTMLGQMMFPAIKLSPTESTYSSDVTILRVADSASRRSKPLLLWGLTFAIFLDLFQQLPFHDVLAMWTYPTFSSFDMRFIVSMMTRSMQKERVTMVTNGMTKEKDSTTTQRRNTDSSVADVLLDGYYDLVRKAVVIGLVARAAVVMITSIVISQNWKHFMCVGMN